MVAGDRVRSGFVVVVAHQVDGIEVSLHLCHLGVLEETLVGARGNSEVEVLVRALRFAIEAFAQSLEEQREVSLVFGTEVIGRPRHSRIFPVHVETIEVMARDEVGGAFDEGLAAVRGQRGVREIARPEPASDGDEDSESGIGFLEREELSQVGVVIRGSGDQLSVMNIYEGVVDAVDAVRIDVTGLQHAILRKHVGSHDGTGARCRQSDQDSEQKGREGGANCVGVIHGVLGRAKAGSAGSCVLTNQNNGRLLGGSESLKSADGAAWGMQWPVEAEGMANERVTCRRSMRMYRVRRPSIAWGSADGMRLRST